MEKILLALNAQSTAGVTNQVLEFAAYIANLNRSKITGVFLDSDSLKPETKPVFGQLQLQEVPAGKSYPATVSPIKERMQQFEQACGNLGARCEIHYTHGSPVQELLKETRFTDLLIIDAELSFKDKPEAVPTAFVREVLANSECPVIVAPYHFNGIDEIIFAYDGSASAVYAIKQFTYLFPGYIDKKITILQVNEEEDLPVTEKEKIGSLLQLHFAGIRYERLTGTADSELYASLLNKKNSFLVMGAFGRSMVSDFFRPSTAGLLVKTIHHPLFIAHH